MPHGWFTLAFSIHESIKCYRPPRRPKKARKIKNSYIHSTTMKAQGSTTFGGIAATTAGLLVALLLVSIPQGAHAQPGSGSGSDLGPGSGSESDLGPGSGSGSDTMSGPSGGSGSSMDLPGSDDDEATTVDCALNGSDAHYEEFLQGDGSTMVRVALTDTGCPNHVSWDINPNFAGVSDRNASIPAFPMMFADNGTKDLSSASGTIGMMRNGVSMYSSWAVDPVEEYEDTAFFLEADSFDPCGGHATPFGFYHYHGTPGCLQEQAGAVKGEHSPLLGWAYDGFPIYGQLGPDGIEMKMCGLEGADDTVCLDVCSGYEAFIDEDEYTYRYYTACGFDESFFPVTLNCYRGCCPSGMTCSDKVDACGDDPVAGYTENLVPTETTSLDVMYDALLIEGLDTDIIDSNFTVNCTLYLGSGGDGTEDDDDATTTTTDGGDLTVDDTTDDAPTTAIDDDVATTSDVGTTSDATDADDDAAAAGDGSGAPLGAASYTPGTIFGVGVITAAAAAMFVAA